MLSIVVYTDGNIKEVKLNGLDDMQDIVEGGIELFDSGLGDVWGYCNEFGKLECIPNIKATKIWHTLLKKDNPTYSSENPNFDDVLYGNIIFCKDGEDLTKEEIQIIKNSSL